MLNLHELFFRWVNFFILCLVAKKLFSTYLSPLLATMMRKEHDALQALKLRKEESAAVLESTRCALQDQQYECQHLVTATTQWRDALAKNIELQQEYYLQRHKVFLQKQQQQYNNLMIEKNYHYLLPSVYQQLEKELQEYFAQAQHQNQYTEDIIIQMTKKEHV